jgi:hypothetical protein
MQKGQLGIGVVICHKRVAMFGQHQNQPHLLFGIDIIWLQLVHLAPP